MLAIYTFVFGVVFSAHAWVEEGGTAGTAGFAIVFFAGLITYTLFSDVMSNAPGLILSNRNYVKKIVFPIEILPVVQVGTALFQAAISFLVLFAFVIAATGSLPWTVLFLPLPLVPLILMILGFCWVVSAAGVYIRDIQQVMPPVLSALMFLSAIFYPLSALPGWAQKALLWLNPLVFPISEVRNVTIFGRLPDWLGLGVYSVIALTAAAAGYFLFQTARKGFADVL